MDYSNQYFILFALCQPVRGARRGTICDLQHGSVQPVPLGLIDILERCRHETVGSVLASLEASDRLTAQEYLQFLEQHEFGFYTEEPERFPPLSLAWDHPSHITNAIVDVDAVDKHDYDRLVRELDSVGVKAIQWRYPHPISRGQLEAMLRALDASRINFVEIILPYTARLADAEQQQLLAQFQRLACIRYFGASHLRRLDVESGCLIIEQPGELILDTCCAVDSYGNFSCNSDLFTEQQQHHVCLNRKLYIDAGGSIRNCPSTQRTFGQLYSRPLLNIVQSQDFQKLWRISRDQMQGCRDCEFRFVCVASDCAEVEKAYPGPFLKPRICRYDPYRATQD